MYQSKLFSAAQTVSDQTANVSKLFAAATGKASISARGYIWIGNYADDRWDSPKLASLASGQPVAMTPRQIKPGTEYSVLGNMVIRNGLPPNNTEYFRAQKSLGVIPRGTRVRIVTSPIGIDREFAVQYWAEVEIP